MSFEVLGLFLAISCRPSFLSIGFLNTGGGSVVEVNVLLMLYILLLPALLAPIVVPWAFCSKSERVLGIRPTRRAVVAKWLTGAQDLNRWSQKCRTFATFRACRLPTRSPVETP